MTTSEVRKSSYGQTRPASPVDKFGVWLSARSVRKATPLKGKRVADFGCGYSAKFVSSVVGELGSAVLVDVALDPALANNPKITTLEGSLEEVLPTLPDASLDIVLCLSVVEHLNEPEWALAEFRRVLAPGGVALINVPSWRGKRFLEFSAFRLGFSPAEEMDDHKRYYDPQDLWPMLVRAGFKPSGIKCKRHKFGLNTFAVCKVKSEDAE